MFDFVWQEDIWWLILVGYFSDLLKLRSPARTRVSLADHENACAAQVIARHGSPKRSNFAEFEHGQNISVV